MPPSYTGDVDITSSEICLPLRLDPVGRTYDLDQTSQRRYVYELVLTDGTDDDITTYINRDVLLELWPVLHLPDAVRAAWRDWLIATITSPG